MTFGVPWHDDAATAPLPDEAALRGHVRAAGEMLAADLRRAEQLSHGWTELPLADLLVDAAFASCLGRLAETGCWGPANRALSAELWEVAGGWLERGSLQRHARFKPRGYAGDWEMMTRIWEGSLGDDPLGRVFDRYFLRQAAPQAVRARIEASAAAIVAARLEAGILPFEIVSVGCGPGIDVALALEALPAAQRAGIRAVLLDLDPTAVDVARERVDRWLPAGSTVGLHENLHRLPKRPGARLRALAASPAIVICSGLFDYLADESAVAMLDCLWRWLGPGGHLLVGNFASHNPTRAFMEWMGDWRLLHRSAPAMQALARTAGLPPSRCAIVSERLGVNLFWSARKEP